MQDSFDFKRLERIETRRKRNSQENDQPVMTTPPRKRSKTKQENIQSHIVNKDLSKKRRAIPSMYTLNKLDPIMLLPFNKKSSVIWKFARPNGNCNCSFFPIIVKHHNIFYIFIRECYSIQCRHFDRLHTGHWRLYRSWNKNFFFW